MNIEIVAGKLRGYDCAECFSKTKLGDDGYHLRVAKTTIPLLKVNEDLHRACGDSVIARAIDAKASIAATIRRCCHCAKPCAAVCSFCRAPSCFRGPCIESHAATCKAFDQSRSR